MSIAELYEIFRAHPVITTDTRQCPKGSIFFALKGERFNGNAFALQALEAGCAYAVVDEDPPLSPTLKGGEWNGKGVGEEGRLIKVDDVLRTLQELAHYHRKQFRGPVIQVTGTNGKTTTKELMAAVLGEKWHVTFTQGNLNNHIGVPRTLLTLPFSSEENEIAVIETGANHPGEIAFLCDIVDPDCGLITNVGRAHLEGFGSFEGVIATKTELYACLRRKKDGFIFLHGDNEHLVPKAEGLKSIRYGSAGHGYCVEGEVVECNPFVKMRWRSKDEADWHEVQTQLIGAYNIDNMLAAAAVGLHFGVAPEQVDHALGHYAPHLGRSELKRTERNTLIVDAYNANLTSMTAALDNFRQIPAAHKMAVLGEMRELGAASAEAHRQVMEMALTLGLERLWLVGEEMSKLANEQISKLTNVTEVRFFHNVEEVKAELADTPLTDFLILIKGSNGTHLYELPEYM